MKNDIELYIINLAKFRNGIRYNNKLDDWLNLICEKKVNRDDENIKKANELLDKINPT